LSYKLMTVSFSREVTVMASIPDGEPEGIGGAPGTDYPLEYEDPTGHHSEDENETDEDEQMEVGAVEGDLMDETTTDGSGRSNSENLKERTHGSMDTSPTDGHFTASEKAKKFIAENRSGCGGGERIRSVSSPETKTLQLLLHPPLTGRAIYGTGLAVAGAGRNQMA
jgi:hypothetical protein